MTLDYAKKIYPLLKGTADFWDNDLTLKGDLYYDADDAAAEGLQGNTNTSTTLAFIRLVYPALIEISQLLNVDPGSGTSGTMSWPSCLPSRS